MGNPTTLARIIETVAGASVFIIVMVTLGLTVLRLALQPIQEPVTKWLSELFDSIIWAAVVVFLVLRPFAIQTFNIPSESMVNTLLIGDYVLVNKGLYRTRDPKVDEIVVFRGPPSSLSEGQTPEKTYLIKRCIGTPGMIVEIRKQPDGTPVLYRNGKPVNEPFARKAPADAITCFKIVNGEPVRWEDGRVFVGQNRYIDGAEADKLIKASPGPIPPGMYLMMGDNRPSSYDSRFWGLLDRERVMGRSEFIWWPPSRIGLTR